MALEDFKKAADLRQKIKNLNSELSRLTIARSQNLIKDFGDKAVAFLESQGFQASRSLDSIKAVYSGSTIQIDLPNPPKPTIGATALLQLSVNGKSRWKIALIHNNAPQVSRRINVRELSEVEQLEQQASELETTISNYDVQPTYTVKYFPDKPQTTPRDNAGVAASSVEHALTVMIEDRA